MNPSPFEWFGIAPRFALNRGELDSAFRDLQLRLHPDKFATATPAERRRAAEQSMQINDAYQQLRDPISRAQLLCANAGFPVDLYVNTALPVSFLMEQMQLRERLESACNQGFSCTENRDTEALEGLQDEVEIAQRVRLAALQESLDERVEYTQAVQTIRELMFYRKLATEIEDALMHQTS